MYTVVTVSIVLLSKYQKLQQVLFLLQGGGGGLEADQMIWIWTDEYKRNPCIHCCSLEIYIFRYDHWLRDLLSQRINFRKLSGRMNSQKTIVWTVGVWQCSLQNLLQVKKENKHVVFRKLFLLIKKRNQ